ncbi:hypothetical protein CAY60_011770 [Shouchella clausii]|jgi:hypothetical protein|uniref:Uncharacterized protein n=3 Tax=Shouchella TaxID=2893057 RepID=Q5WI28_SHOC1|nr:MULTISPECIES: hypothetical protein [Shouchella]MCM3313945.1 hypothetical protein [Psychrobacillus sp. MER TA 17]ALA51420.1 hypothetical protein DB29_00592 [Shouchella clausii]KKI88101.1 hypothetical protein WZ76_01440 [Shouchella clausii]MBU3232823.1 hypothetical protein [Shouchella clausii]MBU3265720.1 hypothetical protein [Shouchella clausii]
MDKETVVLVRKKSPLPLKIGKVAIGFIGIAGVVAGIAIASLEAKSMVQAFLILAVSIICVGLSLLRVQTVTCPHCHSETTIHTLTVDFECRSCLKPTAIKWEK